MKLKKRALDRSSSSVLPVLVAVGVAAASGLFRDARDATDRFHDVDDGERGRLQLPAARPDRRHVHRPARPGRRWASTW